MKVCDYCDRRVDDKAVTCPYCASSSFHEICPRCGSAYDGVFCHRCKAEEDRKHAAAESAYEVAQRASEESRAIEKANRGLIWKTVLTVFIPFVGGFFLINDHVRKGFRIFAIAWCSFMALSVAFSASGSAGVRIVSSLLCLAPVAYYLFKRKDRYLENKTAANLAPVIAFCVVLALSLIGGVAAGV